tara:strand:- start:1633 stop:2202 length:570 start_codon:yes stop_codon:yes gene_type:complete
MKSLISSLSLLFLFIAPISIMAQSGPSDVNPENMSEIFMYDSDEALHKIKVKDEQKKIVTIKAISVYNKKIHEIKIFNYLTFNDIKSLVTKKFNEAKLTKDYRPLAEVKVKVDKMLQPIKEKVKEQRTILNSTLEKELSSKQYKNWLKYEKLQLKKLKPKAPQRSQQQYSPSSQSQRNGYGSGRNRRRY